VKDALCGFVLLLFLPVDSSFNFGSFISGAVWGRPSEELSVAAFSSG
jgi:hypothetical protein